MITKGCLLTVTRVTMFFIDLVSLYSVCGGKFFKIRLISLLILESEFLVIGRGVSGVWDWNLFIFISSLL